MKHSLSLFVAALCFAALFTGCAKPAAVQPEPWQSVMDRYASDSLVRQLLLVKYEEGSNAFAELWLKQDGRWVLDDTCSAYVGRDGLGKTREGDYKTPVGELTVGTAFGILSNPGTAIPYIEAYPSLYACDCDSTYYNTFIDTCAVHHRCKGEHIIAIDPDYHYGLASSYNEERVFGRGCNIFIHCKGSKPYTAGCVALDEPFMRHLLQVCDTHLVVSVH